MEENVILRREIDGLIGDMNISKLALESVKCDMKEKLTQEMGKDIKEVLNGNRIVEISSKEKFNFKVKSIIKKIFRMF